MLLYPLWRAPGSRTQVRIPAAILPSRVGVAAAEASLQHPVHPFGRPEAIAGTLPILHRLQETAPASQPLALLRASGKISLPQTPRAPSLCSARLAGATLRVSTTPGDNPLGCHLAVAIPLCGLGPLAAESQDGERLFGLELLRRSILHAATEVLLRLCLMCAHAATEVGRPRLAR